jgi:hypothetical protein
MRRRLRSVSEAAADEASLLVPDGPELLAGCLVEMGRRLVQPSRVPGLSVEGSGFRSELGRRVERLLALESQTWSAPRRLPLLFVKSILPPVLVLAALSCTAWAEPGLSLVQPAEGDATMNVWKSSWRGSLAATALCALWNPVAMADEQPGGESAVLRAKGDVRVMSVDVPIQISAEEVETFRFPEGQRLSYIKIVNPNAAVVAQTTEEQTARNREQLDRARLGAEEQARKERRERLQRQQTLTHKALELCEMIDALGEGHDDERKKLNEQLVQVERELGMVESLPAMRVRAVDVRGDLFQTVPGTVHQIRIPADADEARLSELKRAVAELEAAMTRRRATVPDANSNSNRMFARTAPQWQRSGIIKAVGSDAGAPALSIDLQDGTVLGFQKLGEGVLLSLRGKEAKLDELKPEMPVALTWIPEQRGWKLRTIDAEPADVRRTETVPGRALFTVPRTPQYRMAPRGVVPAPAQVAPREEAQPRPTVAPPPRSPNAIPGERNTQELEGQVERMRGQMEELQKQISELRDLLKQKVEANQPRQ